MGAMASQMTSLTIVYSVVHSCGDKEKSVTGDFPAQMASNAEMFPFDAVIVINLFNPTPETNSSHDQYPCTHPPAINALRSRQDGNHLTDNNLKCIFCCETVWILVQIAFVS